MDRSWAETPSNPPLEVAELDVVCGSGVPVAVDSTFATPLLQRPLELAATFSLHSATKFIGGYCDRRPGRRLRGGRGLHARQEPRRRRVAHRPARAGAAALERGLRARRGSLARPRRR